MNASVCNYGYLIVGWPLRCEWDRHQRRDTDIVKLFRFHLLLLISLLFLFYFSTANATSCHVWRCHVATHALHIFLRRVNCACATNIWNKWNIYQREDRGIIVHFYFFFAPLFAQYIFSILRFEIGKKLQILNIYFYYIILFILSFYLILFLILLSYYLYLY